MKPSEWLQQHEWDINGRLRDSPFCLLGAVVCARANEYVDNNRYFKYLETLKEVCREKIIFAQRQNEVAGNMEYPAPFVNRYLLGTKEKAVMLLQEVENRMVK